jgi:hypothetical protein
MSRETYDVEHLTMIISNQMISPCILPTRHSGALKIESQILHPIASHSQLISPTDEPVTERFPLHTSRGEVDPATKLAHMKTRLVFVVQGVASIFQYR